MEPPQPEPVRSEPNPASDSHQPRIATPVMDVVPPQSTPQPMAAQPAMSEPAELPVAQPPEAAPADDLLPTEVPVPIESEPIPETAPAPTVPKVANPHTVPIIITVVVVVLLAILAIFAYMQSTK